MIGVCDYFHSFCGVFCGCRGGAIRVKQRMSTGIKLQIYAWMHEVIRDEKSGRIIENIPNAKAILSSDPRWVGVFRYNEMHRRVFIHQEVPGELVGDEIVPRPVQDFDVEKAQAWLQSHGGMWMVSRDTVYAAVRQVAAFNTYHPIRKWLEAVEWDRKERLDTWLIRYCGAPDIPYTRLVSRLFLVGMVRRMMFPGSKMDYMLVLEGPQGIGKSTAAKIIAGEEYFGEAHFKDLDSPDTSIFLKNKWVVEFGEMHALRKNEVNELKLWLSKQVEDYRPKYGRENVHEPRQCVFIGTSNNTEYLNDSTGARRFWPVFCKWVKLDDLVADREQLLAEALVAVRAGEQPFPPKDFEVEHFVTEQKARHAIDPWQEFIEPLTRSHERLSLDLICQKLRLERSKLDKMANARIRDVLVGLGWEYKHTKTARFWRKKVEESELGPSQTDESDVPSNE